MHSRKPSPGAIVYVDHARHLTPLTLSYHATASRHLTTGRTDVIPPSTCVEVDSVYCPRCFTYCAAPPTSLGVCEKNIEGGVGGGSGGGTSCKDCPICFSPVTVSINLMSTSSEKEGEKHLICHYLCGYCEWSSRECGVTSNADKLMEYKTSPDSSSDVAKENEAEKQRQVIISEVSRDLELCLQQKIETRNKKCDNIFRSVVETCVKQENDEARRRRLGVGGGASLYAGRVDSSSGGPGGWSLESLEQSLVDKKKEMDSPWIYSSGGAASASEVETTGDISKEEQTQQPVLPTAQQTSAQMVISNVSPRFRSDLLPLPVPLRARVGRRCLAELAVGKTGILIKPKLNPLEGDTSIKFGQGQWWKKDSSAVHVVPRVQLCRHESDSTQRSFAALLKVRNPTLGMIKLRLSGPSSPGDASSPVIDPLELENILIDPFRENFVKGRICPSDVTSALSPTDWIVLEHAEDAFLDIGKGRDQDPPEVMSWDASAVLSAMGDSNSSSLKVLAGRKDTAWVELKFSMKSDDVVSAERDANDYLAVPIGLEIEVGNGSWEASLIKRRDLPEDEIDIVSFDMVALLR